MFRNLVVVMNISGREPCVSGPSPCFFFKGASWFSAKTSKVHPKSSQCHPGAGSGWISWVYTSTDSAKKKNTLKMHEICIKAQHPWGHVSHQHHIEVLLRVLLRILLFFSTPVIYVVPSVCELVCKTAVLVLSGSNLEKTTHQWASTMGVHNAQLSPACTPITPYLA